MTILEEYSGELRKRAFMADKPNKSGYRRNWYGNIVATRTNDRNEIGRVADSIAEWKRNCCASAY